MGLSKDLKRMSAAIKAKLTGGSSSGKSNGRKGFNMFHFWLVVFSAFAIGFLFYHQFLRKRPKLLLNTNL